MTRTQPDSTRPDRPAHGQVGYLQIPAVDVAASAAFYAQVFGWHVDPPQTGFEAPGLIGQWVTDRPARPDGGLLAWIHVGDIDTALAAVSANGGDVLEAPSPDGPHRMLATIRDPAGNTVGLVSLR
jgi:predicted enzyme related to lactoylglutathione lyase